MLRHAEAPERVLGWALRGGDDYQLCFTLPEEAALPEGCTVIGEVVSGSGVACEPPLAPAVMAAMGNGTGYDHFSAGGDDE
jgi:thiamine-monophosphate kinase